MCIEARRLAREAFCLAAHAFLLAHRSSYACRRQSEACQRRSAPCACSSEPCPPSAMAGTALRQRRPGSAYACGCCERPRPPPRPRARRSWRRPWPAHKPPVRRSGGRWQAPFRGRRRAPAAAAGWPAAFARVRACRHRAGLRRVRVRSGRRVWVVIAAAIAASYRGGYRTVFDNAQTPTPKRMIMLSRDSTRMEFSGPRLDPRAWRSTRLRSSPGGCGPGY